MNLRAFLIGAIASVAAVNADGVMIDHDTVQPFAQPEPITESDRSAVKYKPQLHISYGCHPYPAVQSDGSVSGGLKWSGPPDGECQGSDLGSQVYSRSDWFKDKWAIMYAWYFPKGPQFISQGRYGHRQFWSYGIVWTDNSKPDNSTILGVSMFGGVGYRKASPPNAKFVIGDTTVKFDSYKSVWSNKQSVRLTKKSGETQDLITWEQLTDKARTALNGRSPTRNRPLTMKNLLSSTPQLYISYGCYPHPAVQANGSISGGLKWSGRPNGDCEGSGVGSQVYSCSDWYKDKWAIMYAWYFPKGRYHLSGHRHYWEYAIVWTDSPTSVNSIILGVSMSAGVGHGKATPPMLKYMDGSSVKLESYYSLLGNKAALQLTKAAGETQDLITWDQLTVAARETLNGDALDGNVWLTSKDEVPFKDDIFMERLKDAFPFSSW